MFISVKLTHINFNERYEHYKRYEHYEHYEHFEHYGQFCTLCHRSEKPRQLRCALTNCSLPSLLTTVPLQLVFRHHHVNILISFFSLQGKKEKELVKKMGQRKDPTPSVHSLSSGLSMCFLCRIYPKLLYLAKD
jgi:hypothetical protein